MSKTDEDSGRRSSIRRWMSLKGRGSIKKKMVQNVLDKQTVLEHKIESLVEERKGVLDHLTNTNQIFQDLAGKISALACTQDYRKDFENETKQQLQQMRRDCAALTDKLKQTTEEKHRLELQVSKLENQIDRLKFELKQMTKEKEHAKEEVIQERNKVSKLREEQKSLKSETQSLENTIRELKVDNELLKENISLLKYEVEEGEEARNKMRKERQQVVEYSKNRTKAIEEKLKMCWFQLLSLKNEKDQLKDKLTATKHCITTPKILNNGQFVNLTSNNPDFDERTLYEHQKTKIIQLELQLYRRDKLVEILVERLKQTDSSFNLATDPSLLAYVDENLSVMAMSPYLASSSESGSSLSTVQSNLTNVTGNTSIHTMLV